MKSPTKYPALRRKLVSANHEDKGTRPLIAPDFMIRGTETFSVHSHEKSNDGRSAGYTPIVEEFVDPNDLGTLCSRCQKLLADDDDYEEEVTVNVLTVTHRLEKVKEQRKKDEQRTKINEILERVENALRHGDFDLLEECAPIAIQDGFNMQSQKQKQVDRNNIAAVFNCSETLSNSRNEVIQDIECCLSLMSEDLTSFCSMNSHQEQLPSEEHFHRMNKALRKSSEAIKRLSRLAQRRRRKKTTVVETHQVTKENKTLDKPDIETTTTTESVSNDAVTEEIVKPYKRIFNEKDLMNPKLQQQAIKMVLAILDDGTRLTTGTTPLRSNFKHATKQINIMSELLVQKLGAVKEFQQQVQKNEGELENMKSLEEQRKKDQLTISKLIKEKAKLQKDINSLQQDIQFMSYAPDKQDIVVQNERKLSIRFQDDHTTKDDDEVTIIKTAPSELAARQVSSMFSTSTTKSNLQISNEQRSRSVIHLTDKPSRQYTDNRLQNTDNRPQNTDSFRQKEDTPQVAFKTSVETNSENNELKQQMALLQQQHKMAMRTIEDQENRISSLSRRKDVDSNKNTSKGAAKVEMYEKRLQILEMHLEKSEKERYQYESAIEAEQAISKGMRKQIELLTSENSRLKDQLEESGKLQFDTSEMTRDQVLAKIKTQSEHEFIRLRNYISKEQHRFQACIRKLEMENDSVVKGLRKEKWQIMRALSRFKKVVMKFIQNEDIENETGLIDIIGEERTTNNMCGGETVSEILTSLEEKLGRALLNKRLMLKELHTQYANTEKTLHQCRKSLKKAADDCEEKDRTKRHALDCTERIKQQYNMLRQQNVTLRKEIEPCKELLDKYNSLKKKVDWIKVEKNDTTKEMKQMFEDFEQDRSKLKAELQKLNQQANPINEGAPWNQLNSAGKMEMFNKALYTNRVSKEDHDLATQVLSYTSNIVIQQFADLLTRYIEMKRVHTVRHMVSKASRIFKSDKRFTDYLSIVEKRHKQTLLKWAERKKQLVSMKIKSSLLLSRLLNEPNTFEFTITSSQKTHQVERETVKKLSKTQLYENRKAQPPAKFLEELVGQRLTRESKVSSYWQMPPYIRPPVYVTTPKVLEMDVHNWKKQYTTRKTKGREALLPPIATIFP